MACLTYMRAPFGFITAKKSKPKPEIAWSHRTNLGGSGLNSRVFAQILSPFSYFGLGFRLLSLPLTYKTPQPWALAAGWTPSHCTVGSLVFETGSQRSQADLMQCSLKGSWTPDIYSCLSWLLGRLQVCTSMPCLYRAELQTQGLKHSRWVLDQLSCCIPCCCTVES